MMVACFWFAVMMRGEEITSLLPSFWAADSSRSRRWVPDNTDTPMLPLVLAAGRFTWYRLFSVGKFTNPEGFRVDGGNAELNMESVPRLLPDTVRRLLLPEVVKPEMPSLAPKSRSKVSLTITMRASINTCLTGTSSVCTRRRMSARFSDVSCTSSVLVRSSTDRLPRADNMEFLPPEEDAPAAGLISLARSATLA